MKRREFLALVGGAAAALPLAARARQGDRVRRVGVMMPLAEGDPQTPGLIAAFARELTQAGWTIGHDLRIDYRWGTGGADAPAAAAAQLLSLAPDVIVADGWQQLSELRRAARTVPIVFMEISEPVFYGFVDSLAHPTGNMTGFTGLEPATGAKWLELLAQIAPRLTRVAVVFNPRTAPHGALFSLAAEGAAQTLAIEVVRSPIYEAADIEEVMTMLAQEPAGGVIVPVDPFTDAHRDLIIALAARERLPAIYGARTIAAAGGLASYGIDLADQLRQTAGYVDRLLRGQKPVDLPVRPPSRLELAINLKTAKALGLAVPPSLLATADTVIE